jgi:hypothetical protein
VPALELGVDIKNYVDGELIANRSLKDRELKDRKLKERREKAEPAP